ncbi:MAG: cell wall metabolism sensor histidine kinase WalK [Lachnospiraceae bacterium]|nr:cell wall metabolism sensor histidine kinase WalK [Lachnospiraceae bacterium]
MKKNKKIRDFFKSLKFRLVFLCMMVGIVSTVIIRIGIMSAYESRAVSNRSIDILSQAKILANQMVDTGYVDDTSSETITAQLEQLSQIYDGRVMIIDSSFHIVKDTYDLDTGKTIISEEVVKSFQGREISNYDSQSRYIEMTIPLVRNDPEKELQETIGVMLVSVSTDSIASTLSYMQNRALILGLIIAILLFAFGFLIAGRITRPFREMASSIQEIQTGYGDNDGELNIDKYTETVQICEKFNKLYSRMKMLDDSRQEFVSNVSHELKTPLTSMKVLADSLNGQEDVPVELYREFMQDIGNEIERENKIINDLLSLVKMDKSASDLNIASVNINEMIEQILKRLRPIAEKQQIELVLESFRPVTAEIDEVKLTLAITNLIENGIKYNKENGWVHVSLNADHQYFYVKVEDSGIGIPEESLEHIYERFYRVDKSHSREIGGTGLGLAITRNAVLMHRGAIKVFSTEGEGTMFTVRIPLNYIA